MKGIIVFILGAATAFAADFVTGQAARLVIGQVTFTAADPNSTNSVIGAASGVAFAGNTLFVVDDNRMGAVPANNRVLVFSNVSSTFPRSTDQLLPNTKCPVCVGQASVVLGQPDFLTTTTNLNANQSNLREPTAAASDGVHLAVADTNHNRILIWNRIPTVNDVPADVVVGQTDFAAVGIPPNNTPTASSLRGPQGVWIQNGKLFVADSQNNRVLIYNHIPTANGAAADVVLGQPNFTTFVQQDITQQTAAIAANTMLNPVSVTTDGVHLFVTDLGYNRVLIWNSIPTTNQVPADVEIGQPDMISGTANNAFSGTASAKSGDGNIETAVLCTVSNGTDASGNPTYPAYCNATLNFPRFAMSDGTRLYVADGGNDRVLEYETIPTANAASADIILGQVGGTIDQATDAADSLNTPTSLAWDGSNLYVADPYNRRVMVYTPSPNPLPYQGLVNSANTNVYATGQITIGGTINAGDVITVTVDTAQYAYTVKAADSLATVTDGVAAVINASNDPNVTALADENDAIVVLNSILPGSQGNSITYSCTVSSGAKITATAGETGQLRGGGNAASVAPGTLVTITGSNLSAGTASADLTQTNLPTTLGGTQVYINGIRSPLLFVSPTEIHSQVSWAFTDTTSVNAYVRSEMPDGSVMVTSPVAATIVPANPGIFGQPGTSNPEVGLVYHGSSYAAGVISVDGTAVGSDTATITIQDRTYAYIVQESDTVATIRDALIALMSQDPFVNATAAGPFQRIILTAKLPGPDGNDITYGATSGSSVVMTAFGSQLCCANVKGSPVTPNNPALPGELVMVYATGIGLPVLDPTLQALLVDGQQYPANGPVTIPPGDSAHFVSGTVGGKTADILQVTLLPGSVGLYEVLLHLNASLASNANTAMTIAQNVYVSNAIAFPVYSTTGQ
jgi:uncharacterized protein (TIGR03437 family)